VTHENRWSHRLCARVRTPPLSAPVKAGKSRQIAANETSDRRASDPYCPLVRSADGHRRSHTSAGTTAVDAVRFRPHEPREHDGELAASLSHEITQPIASARNNARAALNFLGKQSPDLGEAREALDSVVGNADRAGEIVDRIRANIRKAPPRKDYFDFNAAIGEVIALARNAIIKNGTLQYAIPGRALIRRM